MQRCRVRWMTRSETIPGPMGQTVRTEQGRVTSNSSRIVEQQIDETGIEPDEAMQAAIAGVIAALATGGISLIEAMDRVAQIFEEGSTIERRPPLSRPGRSGQSGRTGRGWDVRLGRSPRVP